MKERLPGIVKSIVGTQIYNEALMIAVLLYGIDPRFRNTIWQGHDPAVDLGHPPHIFYREIFVDYVALLISFQFLTC